MFKLVIADDEGKTTTVPLVREEITIGRKEGNTIRLTDRNVSRRHARLQKQNGHYLLQDLGSYNGIVINGARLADARPLKHGDQILIGDYKLAITEEATTRIAAPAPAGSNGVVNGAAETLTDVPAMEPGRVHPAPTAPGIPSAKVANGSVSTTPGAPPPAPAAAFAQSVPAASAAVAATSSPSASSAATMPPPAALPDDLRQLRLVFLSPAGVPPPVVLERLPLILGRSEAADIALPFPSISREHARLFAEDDQLMIEDLGSSNGILVNGEKNPRAHITPGDLVTLGVVEFRVARRGDSTMVVHREAEAQREALTRRSPWPILLGVVAGGTVLGALVFLMIRSNGGSHVASPSVVPSPQPVALAVQSPAPVQPVEPPVQPTAPVVVPPPTIAAGAPETAPDPVLEPVVPTHAPSAVREPSHGSSHTRRAVEIASTAPAYVPSSTPTASRPGSSNIASTQSSAASAATPPANPMTDARAAMSRGDNAGVVHALEGHATTEPEIGLLAITYRQMGNRPAAERTMRRYLTRFPGGPRSESFHDYLDAE